MVSLVASIPLVGGSSKAASWESLTTFDAVMVMGSEMLSRLSSLCFLPKHTEALEIRDFRLINLIHSMAKLVTKVLAMHVALHMLPLVEKHQSAFVCGRCLHDNY
jgi:hypothetical protein